MKTQSLSGKLAYGALFIFFVPLLLILWAEQTSSIIHLPMTIPVQTGLVLTIAGILFLLSGVYSLYFHGKGLPMNAFPPPVFVRKNIYHYCAHPIYTGFCMLCGGLSIVFKSASGFWLVTPAATLGCAAIVYGFENQDLSERFGTIPKPLLALPSDQERPPLFWEKISVVILLFIPWVLLYELVILIGLPPDAVESSLPFEYNLPVIEWTEIIYSLTYLFTAAVPFIIRSAGVLRTFMIRGCIATAAIIFCFLILPITSTPRSFVPSTFLGELLMFERVNDSPAAAFPSFHVVWAILAVSAYAASYQHYRAVWWSIAAAISVSCITTGMHSLIDVIAGIIAAAAVMRVENIWNFLRRFSERIANSWKEWRFNGIRIINHGAYAGAGTFAGLTMIGYLLGKDAAAAVLIVAFSSMITAALWAQFIEGSPALLRPYGYYGGLIGGIFGCVIAQYAGIDLWLLLAAFGTAGPLIQLAGRLRCLVQGCCHGHPANTLVGIRYTHPRSRVCRLSEWNNVPLHPTPLYSILWNIVTGLILLRFWTLSLPPSFIAGMYLVLNGMGRFVEESFRGEPQTPILGKLRLYQLMAILSVLTGIIFTMIPTTSVLPASEFHWNSIISSGVFGLCTWFALGVDFPNSNRRFARLV
ncbi:MAG: prolipoprotein diacylglyceryl transferase family protein [Bacteroidota bacterium]